MSFPRYTPLSPGVMGLQGPQGPPGQDASFPDQTANTVLAGPSTGSAAAPSFRSLVAADVPNIAESQVTNLTTDLAAKATDSLVVHLAGAEAISGAKTFADATLKQNNSAGTFAHTLASAATAVRVWTIPDATDTAAGIAATQTLTNKTISGASNTLSSIGNASLTNPSLTLTAGTGLSGGGSVALGASVTVSMPTTGPGAGTIGGGTTWLASVTLDAQGRVTAASASNPLTIGSTVGSGTAKSILYVDASGFLAQDNANFAWDATNHRLGIGTASPSVSLDVAGGFRVVLPTGGSGIVFRDAATPISGNLFSVQSNDGTATYFAVQAYAAGAAALTLSDGASAAVSASNVANLIYNNTTHTLRTSLNTGAYTDLITASGGTMTGALLFSTDNTIDIGATGATRPRTGWFGTSVRTALLDRDTAGGLSIGTATATLITIGKSGITTQIQSGLTQSLGVFNFNGNAASSIATTSGSGNNITYTSGVTMSGSATGHVFNTTSGVTSGDKIASFQHNSTEIMGIGVTAAGGTSQCVTVSGGAGVYAFGVKAVTGTFVGSAIDVSSLTNGKKWVWYGFGTVAAGALANSDLALQNATTSNYYAIYHATGGGVISNANLSAAAFTGALPGSTWDVATSALTTGQGLGLSTFNVTAATSGVAVQNGPMFESQGHVWNTTATAADNWASIGWQSQGVSGTTPTVNYVLYRSVAATATRSWTKVMTITDAGAQTFAAAGALEATGVLTLGAASGTTSVSIGKSAGTIGLYGVTAVVQPQTTGQTAGYSAGASTAVTIDGTFTGGLGSTAYTVGDAIKALKQLGAMKQ